MEVGVVFALTYLAIFYSGITIFSVSTEIFDRGFLYLLVGTVGGTKNEMEVQEF